MATRRERIILELEDRFTAGMTRAAAVTKALDSSLTSLSGTSVQTSRTTRDIGKSTETLGSQTKKTTESTKGLGDQTEKTTRKTRELSLEQAVAAERAARLAKSLRDQARALVDQEQGIDRASEAAVRGERGIDRYSGRLRLLTEAATLLGPALVPIGAAAIPAVFGLTAALGAAAGAAGVAALAFNGVGDVLDAIDAAQLSPTTENLQAMRDAMQNLGPAGAQFAHFIDSLEPQMRSLQLTARAGLFPGVEDGIGDLLTMLPQVRAVVFNLAAAMGDLTAEAGSALSGPGFAAFFNYLESDAAPTLTAFGHTIGNVAQGLGSMLAAFAPLSRDFSSGMESMSRSFAHWAAGLSETDGFRSFVAYVRETGPQVLDLLGSMGSAFVDIARAAAPVGSAVLPALTGLARVLGTIASSPIGGPLFTAAAGMLALSRAAKIADAAMLKFSGSTAAGTKNLALLGAGLNFATILAGIWAVDAALDKVFGDRSVDGDSLVNNLTNLTSSDAAAELDKIGVSIQNINSSVLQGTDKVVGFLPGQTDFAEARDNIDKVDQALAQLVQSGNADQAADAMAEIVKQAHAQGISTEEATKWFKEYNAALADTKSADTAADAQRRYAGALRASARVNALTRAQVAGLNEAMEAQVSAALGAFDAVTRYAEALAAAQRRAKNTNAGIDASTAAGRKNRDTLSQLAQAWNNQGDAVGNNMKKWQAARSEFISVAKQMGATGAEARSLANKILEIPRQRQIDIKMYGSEQAASQIERIRAAVTSIPRTWSTTYYVNQVNSISRRFTPGHIPGADGAGADGGTVHGPRLPYRDKMLYALAPGEEIISNRRGQADKHRALLKAINSGYANGGTVGRPPAQQMRSGGSGSTSVRVVERIVERMPDRVVLEAGGTQFTAYVRREAADMARSEVDDMEHFRRVMDRT